MAGALSRTAVAIVATTLVSPAAASRQGQSQAREQVPVIIEVRDDGFGWGAAGIGAVGGFGLAIVATALVGRVSMPRRPLGNTQPPSSSTDPPLDGDTDPDPPHPRGRSRASGAEPKKGDPR